VSSPDKKPTSRQAVRRKLLGGAFSAPAVLTLYSGNALAAGSSLRCLTFQTNPGSTSTKTVGVSTSLDTWLRVPLFTTGAGTTGSPYRYYIKGSDVTPFQRPGRTCFITASQSQEFNPTTNTQVNACLPGLPTGMSSSTCGKYVAVRFDGAGNVTGCGKGASGTSAMPGTCWASAAANL
jgi:hypothetical protein